MKNMSKTAKFFVICAVVFTLGLVLTIGGCAAGGITGIQEAVDGRITNNGPAETDMIESDYEFSSVEVSGDADFVLVGSKYYDGILDDKDITGAEAKTGKVIAVYEKGKAAPEIKTEDGKLIINADTDNEVHFSELFEPTVIIFCDDKELESVSVKSSACDLEMRGVSFRTANIEMNAGDVELKDIISGGLRIVSDAGDTEISGVLRGITDVDSDAGSIEINVFTGIRGYTMELHADAGDIKVGEDEIDGNDFKQQGGTDSGNNILDPTSLDFVLKAFGIEDYTFDSNVLALHTIVGNEGSNSPPMATEFDGPGLHPIVQQNIGALEEFFPEAAKEQAGLIDSIVNGYMGDSCKLYMANIWDTDNNAVAYIVADIGKDTLTVVDVVMDGCEKSVASGDPRALVYYCGKINRRPTEVHIPVNASANGMRCENIPNNEMTKK